MKKTVKQLNSTDMWNSRKYREFKEKKNGNVRKKREFKEKKLEP